MTIFRNHDRTLRWTTGLCLAAVGAAMAHLMLHFSGYIYKFHATSLFQDTAAWFAGHFEKPAALLLYAGRFLTQFCYYPALAVAMLLALYAVITWLCYRYFLRGFAVPLLAVIPATALFVSLMRIGYGVVMFRADALIFTEPLGILGALLLWRLLSAFPADGGWVYAPVPIVAAAGYPLVGCYALLAVLTFAASVLTHAKGRVRYALPAVALLSVALAPWLEYLLIYGHSVLRYMWFQGAPCLDYVGAPAEFLPLVLSGLCLPAFACLGHGRTRKASLRHAAASVALCAALLTGVYLLPDRSSLLHRQMECERAIENGDWDTVAAKTLGLKTTNDVLIAYRNCALYAKGHLAERCMNYSFQTVPLKVFGLEYSSSIVAGPTIFFHSGLLNYSARISSEISLYTDYAVERWKYLAKTAIFNGEEALAEKYLKTLEHTTLHKAWARRYTRLLHDGALLAQDPEYKLLHPLQDYDERNWMPSDNAAADVLMFYYFVPGRSPEMQEWNRAARRMVSY